MRELIRRDEQRLRLRGLLLEGAQWVPKGPADEAWFSALRADIADRSAGAA